MIPTVILSIVILLALIIYFTMNTPMGIKQRTKYLESMAHLFESKLEPVLGAENSYRMNFNYHGNECSYEEIEVQTSKSISHCGFLKVRTPSRLSLSFTERARTQIRSNVQSLEDVAASMWGTSAERVTLPKHLQDFHVYTNNTTIANKFLKDEKVIKIFTAYRNRDSRGHPVMSLEIVEGVISLEFHTPGELTPSIIDLQHNVTAAETYLQELLIIAEALKTAEKEVTN